MRCGGQYCCHAKSAHVGTKTSTRVHEGAPLQSFSFVLSLGLRRLLNRTRRCLVWTCASSSPFSSLLLLSFPWPAPQLASLCAPAPETFVALRPAHATRRFYRVVSCCGLPRDKDGKHGVIRGDCSNCPHNTTCSNCGWRGYCAAQKCLI